MNHNKSKCDDHGIYKGSHALPNSSNILALHCNSVIPILFSLLFLNGVSHKVHAVAKTCSASIDIIININSFKLYYVRNALFDLYRSD